MHAEALIKAAWNSKVTYFKSVKTTSTYMSLLQHRRQPVSSRKVEASRRAVLRSLSSPRQRRKGQNSESSERVRPMLCHSRTPITSKGRCDHSPRNMGRGQDNNCELSEAGTLGSRDVARHGLLLKSAALDRWSNYI